MKKVLLIANQYPPLGGPGVQRSCKFVKYLRDFEYEPVVLTRVADKGILDHTLLDDVPKHQIYRTKSYDFTQWPGPLALIGKVVTRAMVPDADYVWSVKSFDQAVEIIEKEKIDILYTTSFPYSDHLLGAKLKERFPKLPWVVDFRDEWTQNPYILDKNYKAKRATKEKEMEAMVASKCDKFIANTTFMLDNFLMDYPQLKSKSFVITNGYDDSDFADTDPTYKYKDTFTITYGGAMYGRRKPDKLFKAVRNLIDQKLIDPSKFRMKLIGGMDFNKINGYLDTYKLKELVRLSDYLPHKEILKELSLTDVLLLLIGEGKGAKSFASGKIFEYINSNRPILAVVPEVGAAADIIRESNSGVVCEQSSVEAIMAGVLELYQRWENKNLIMDIDQEAIKKYHRKELTRNLASIFDSLS